ncbi:hypothetical protein IW262DRAFT_1296436 [Armillaria fumosa]|nr:hypothetical protein IW262DRAFT_1296436 [Armillaria fumosa]
MCSQKLAFVFLVLNATVVFCAPTADPSSVHEPKCELHARAKSSQTSSTGFTLCGVKAQTAKPGVCKYKPFDDSKEETDSSAQDGQDCKQGLRYKYSSPDSAQSDTEEADAYSPLSHTNTQMSRLKAQLTASRLMLKGKDTSTVGFENLACHSFDALTGIIEKSKAEQLKLKEEWLRTTNMLPSICGIYQVLAFPGNRT